MRFAFTDEQEQFRSSVRELLRRECPPALVRAAWREGDGRSATLWRRLAELGLVGLTVPERLGGVGGDELDLVLPLEETGRAALPAPILETTAVGVPLLGESEALAAEWLPRVASGDAILTVGLEGQRVADAHVAALLLLEHAGEVHAVKPSAVTLEAERSVDGARRLFRVRWAPTPGTRLCAGPAARRALGAAFDRGALATAAQLLGLGQHMLDLTVAYVKVREQFGRPIGSYQAVKHHLANALGALELARPVVYRAAHAVARGERDRGLHVSMAKARAAEAAALIASAALQCHGAIGYSFEHDLHLWMKRAWALRAVWGDPAWHRARVGRIVLDREDPEALHG